MKLLVGLFLIGIVGTAAFFIWFRQSDTQTSVLIPTPLATSQQLTVVAAGDIACNDLPVTTTQCQQEATAKLVDQINPDLVLTLGDEQYGGGSLNKYMSFYDKSWGRFKSKTKPSIGNHEYEQDDEGDASEASGYFDYFNGIGQLNGPAGQRPKGYYSYQKNGWSFYALNTNCGEIGGCGENSPEGQWLEQELSKNLSICQVAYFHQPLFSSGLHGQILSVQPFWNILYRHHVDLILNGHDHIYERFSPQDPDGKNDPANGIREFVVGTGGRNLYQITKVVPNSEVRVPNTFGVLKLNLDEKKYDWSFIDITNQIKDSGYGSCF